MAVNFEQAVAIVRAALEPGWTIGTFVIDDRNIVENDLFYVVNAGAREYLVDGDFEYAIAGDVTVVNKQSGEMESRPSVEIAIDSTIRISVNPNSVFGRA
ncbi:hypothetical protein [Nocardia amikacinitolerans]|uniref:hypothetical protein n=1 Tax=Nocardia amikacinitolerans TaxID=756689 RepID=UPI0020A45046|nr:hypothetical protein [Nocardia amikacinitolerans]MCP2292231.1 hypothetical protein [Nocardia amikacinitolerans]